MNQKLIGLIILLYCTSCGNNSNPSSLSVDSLPTSTHSKPIETLQEFKEKLLKANPLINKVQLQFQLDTFSIERKLDSALGPSLQDDRIGSARNMAILSYLSMCDKMADSVKKVMNKDSTVFVEEEKAWRTYYFKTQAAIGETDDDEYLGLGFDYSTLIGQDLLQVVKHRAITIFTRLKRVNGMRI